MELVLWEVEVEEIVQRPAADEVGFPRWMRQDIVQHQTARDEHNTCAFITFNGSR